MLLPFWGSRRWPLMLKIVGLIGFGTIESSAHTWPLLTTVRIPREQIGKLVVRRLREYHRASDPSVESLPSVTLEVSVSLIVR